jgi:hypothetical protein
MSPASATKVMARQHLHPPQTHQGAHHQFPFPPREGVLHRLGQPLQSFRGCVDGMDVLLESRLRHEQTGKVTLVGVVPAAFTGITIAQAQKKPLESKASPTLLVLGAAAGPNQIADGFILLVGHMDGRQLTGPIQPRQLLGVASVGFDAVGGLLGNEG